MRSSSFTIPLIASLATGGTARADTLLDTHSPTDYAIPLALAHDAAALAFAAQGRPVAFSSFVGAGIYVYPTRNVTIGRLSARVRATDSLAQQSGKFVIYQVDCDHDSSHSSCAPQDIDAGNSGFPATARRFETGSVRIPSADAEGSPSGLATAVVDGGAPGTGLVLQAKVVYAIGFVSTDGLDTLWTGAFPLTLDAWKATPPLPKFNDPDAPALMTFGRGIVFGYKESQNLGLQSFTGLPGILIEDRPTTTTSGGGSGADAPADGDRDGVADTQDNCPTVYNPNQADHDHDGSGDACQSDGGCNAGGGAALPLPAALLALALRRRRRGTP